MTRTARATIRFLHLVGLLAALGHCGGGSNADPSLEVLTGGDAGTTPGDICCDISRGDSMPGDLGSDGNPGEDGTGPTDQADGTEGPGDHSGEVPEDAGDADLDPDVLPIEEPFAPCEADQPCPSTLEPICLLLPGSETQGICVAGCSPGADSCPPWLQCVFPDTNRPDWGVCLDTASMGHPCDYLEGTICQPGTYCVSVPESEATICTVFCNLAETICQPGHRCITVGDEEPDPDWGACLPAPLLADCDTTSACINGFVCVDLGFESSKCAQDCPTEGLWCDNQRQCFKTLGANGSDEFACLEVKGQSEVCNPDRGVICEAGLFCSAVDAPDGWNRCLAPCNDGSCSSAEICKNQEGTEGTALCVPAEFAADKPTPCSAAYPCPLPGDTCLAVEALGYGLCLPGCDTGCPEGTVCDLGACVTWVPAGGPCLEEAGLFCPSPATCLRDKGDDTSGYCAMPCDSGLPSCQGGAACLEVPEQGTYCLLPRTYGELCSLDDGTACDSTQDLTCMHLSQSDQGFCTPSCQGPGTCPDGPPGTQAECTIMISGKSYCGFLCGPYGSDCPQGLECSGIGICNP